MKVLIVLMLGVGAIQEDANPIRKIVTLLQDMQKETEAEGVKEKELYDKFMCFCSTGEEDLAKTVSDSKSAVETLTAKHGQMVSEKASLAQDIETHTADAAQAEKDLSEAEAIRTNEKTAYDAEYASKTGTEAALAKAIPAIEAGLAGSAFVQTSGVNVALLTRAVQGANQVLTDGNKRVVLEYLQGHTPGSSEIVGMLKAMKDEMSRTIAGLEKSEASSAKGFADMSATKKKEIEFAKESIESKKERSGTLAVEIIQTKDGFEDAAAEQAEAEKMLSTLDQQCADKKKEWAEKSKMRTEEIAAIGQAIAILNDDDALDVFKKSAALIEIKPSPKGSFLQMKKGQSSYQLLDKAQAIIWKAAMDNKDHAVQTMLLAMRSKLKAKAGGAVDFGQVVKMVDEMVAVLASQQKDDVTQKEFCIAELTKSEAEMKASQDKVNSLSATIEEMTDAIADAEQTIADLTASISALDKDVAVATENRKEEHSEYLETVKLTETAIELVGKAKNRLAKFYNPSTYKAPPKVEMSMEDKIVGAGTSALAQQEASFDAVDDFPENDAPLGFVQVKRHFHLVAPQAPKIFLSTYEKKSTKSAGVMELMTMMVTDLKASLAESEFAEKTAQSDYTKFMAASQEKRATDSESMTNSAASKADLSEKLTSAKESQHLTMKELENIHSTISGLHSACDFIIKNFDYRAEARAAEMEGLKKAKAVLSGASYA